MWEFLKAKFLWLFAFLGPLQLPIGILTAAYVGVSSLGPMLDGITSVVSAADSLMSAALSSEIGGKVNRFFPLSELIGMLSTLGSLRVAVFAFKAARLVIPGF